MKKLLGLMLAGTAAAGAMTGCGADDNTIKIAILPAEQDSGDVNDELLAMTKYIGLALDKEVELIMSTDNSAAALAASTGEVDLVWGSTGTFWEAEAENIDLEIFTTIAPEGDITKGGYMSIIGTHNDNITALEGKGLTKDTDGNYTHASVAAALKGESFAFQSATSTSGGKLPNQFFFDNTTDSDYANKEDIFTSDAYLGKVSLTQNHTTTIENINEKTVMAGAFYDGEEAYDTHKANITVLAEMQAPADPLWGSLSEADAKKMNDYLSKLTPETAPDLFAAGDSKFEDDTVRFTAAAKSHASYQNILKVDTQTKRNA